MGVSSLGVPMRRKQSALLISLLVLSSLAFVSQTRPQSPVSSVDPDLAEGQGSPVTDQDSDQIPDLYEVIFSDDISLSTTTEDIVIRGLEPSDSTDNNSDNDRDGLSALQEFCWPYTLEWCFEERDGLTGKSPEESESGLREFLDPRVSDTDGDGLPDGYEVHMCTNGLYRNNPADPYSKKTSWECLYFDPLDPSDIVSDLDRCKIDFSWGCGDGFDFNGDGLIDFDERFTSPEEYLFGSPIDWVTERDGLWCVGHISGLTPDSCQNQFEIPVGDNKWMGTDPRFDDSDYFFWNEVSPSELELMGDGIPDGWEAHHGMNPLNASDALLDSDSDGWDSNADGFITLDLSSSALWGESLSNLEEYNIDFDQSNNVNPGLVGFRSDRSEEPKIFANHLSGIELVDYSVHTVIADQPRERLLVGSLYGISIVDPSGLSSVNFELPSGLEMKTMETVAIGNDEFLILGTNIGIHYIRLVDGIPNMDSIISHEIGYVSNIAELTSDSDDSSVVFLGEQMAWKSNLFADDPLNPQFSEPEELGGLSEMISDGNATALSIGHASIEGRIPLLLIGTDVGLIAWNTTDGSLSMGEPWWVFNRFNAEEFVTPNIFNPAESGKVSSIAVESNPGGSDYVWIGTGGGMHRLIFSLIFSQPENAFDSQNMMNFDGLIKGANEISSILPLADEIAIGSKDGIWFLEGNHEGVIGVHQNQTEVNGLITSMTALDVDDESWVFVVVSPGQYMNIARMNPHSHDSDLDGMPDGWEHYNGLDPTNPYDANLDPDSDGISISWNGGTISRDWTNLEEFRFASSTVEGLNSTDPRESDSDGDGLSDGQEYWGWFPDSTFFGCYYLNEEYFCDSEIGNSAREVHLGGWLGSGSGGGTDSPTDPTNPDTDGDGMPDGWEIQNRRWIGDLYTGGNQWTLDPRNPNDAYEDADGDGLDNLCEYEWSIIRENALLGGLESHGESNESVALWVPTDPNSIDSDNDSLPDGWEARYSCVWPSENSGINPMNGSDFLSNPDGDGFDVNRDGIIDSNESLVNWMEYHLKSEILISSGTLSGIPYPGGFTSQITHQSWPGLSSASFGERMGPYISSISSSYPVIDVGAANPLSPDTDGDGMPDGWEFYNARWTLLDQKWTLNPVNNGDGLGDPDFDGMSNWEEYNSIDSQFSETDGTISSPQFYLSDSTGTLVATPWIGAQSPLSFGHFISEEQKLKSGLTSDPNDPDTDDDGLLDGVELIFTSWNSTEGVWTLNPLTPGDGKFDSDNDGISDIIELNLTKNRPVNGGLSPQGAPLFWVESHSNNPLHTENRIFRILFGKEGRADLAMDQYLEWKQGNPEKTMLSSIMGVSDPKDPDTDRDGMSDGFEYWFTEWNLEENRWDMNPLSNSDTSYDSDGDSYDCNGDGELSDSEIFDNLAEFDSMWFGKRLAIGSTQNGTKTVSYGTDAVNALIEEEGITEDEAWGQLYLTFSTKSPSSSEKVGLINQIDFDNFNKTLAGISDPTDDDSDRDGMPDGWEYCYSEYLEVLPVNSFRWSLNPINPLDAHYDPDLDGWFGRQFSDIPAKQGNWIDREFNQLQSDMQISSGVSDLLFTNIMEYLNGTEPMNPDSDSDSLIMSPIFDGPEVIDYVQDMSLSDGREIFKFGTNPLDNDTDGDMMPDYYEYYRGWNETNDNWSSFEKIKVQWLEVSENNWKPISISNDTISRPLLDWTWFTHDPTDPSDSIQDPDQDGGWDCSGISGCTYIPYNNFQEFYAVANATLNSPSAVRAASLFDCSGSEVEEWWQLRESLLGTCFGANNYPTNYLRMNKIDEDDLLYALVVIDNDVDYEDVNPSNDEVLVNGGWADSFNRIAGDRFHLPNPGLGEYPYGWWILDIDGDLIADGTDPANWDTDGDWLNDYFEINDDLLDGIRGNSGSPIRYDDRTT